MLDAAFIAAVDNSHNVQDVSSYSYTNSQNLSARGSLMILETDGGEIEADSRMSMYGNSGATTYMHVNIDDIQDFNNAEMDSTFSTSGFYAQLSSKKIKKLPAGIHVVQTKILVNAATLVVQSIASFAKELGKGGKNS